MRIRRSASGFIWAAPLALIAYCAAAAEPHGITVLGNPPPPPAVQTTSGPPAATTPTVTVDYDAPGREPYQA